MATRLVAVLISALLARELEINGRPDIEVLVPLNDFLSPLHKQQLERGIHNKVVKKMVPTL
jgi:hypothetical protein